MPFQFLNDPETSAPTDQIEPDARDFEIMLAAHSTTAGSGYGTGPTGVQSGCAVTAQGTPDQTVSVAAGVVRIGGRQVTVASGNVSLTAADATNPRVDLITVDTTGTKAALAGTASADPVYPALPAGKVILAQVFRAANDNTIQTADITDKRVLVDRPGVENILWYGADATGAADSSVAIQAAIDSTPTTGVGRGNIIYFPPGQYKLNTTINLKEGIVLEGTSAGAYREDRYGSCLVPGTAGMTMLIIDGGANVQHHGPEFRNLIFQKGAVGADTKGVVIRNTNRCNFYSCSWNDISYPVYLDSTADGQSAGDCAWHNFIGCHWAGYSVCAIHTRKTNGYTVLGGEVNQQTIGTAKTLTAASMSGTVATFTTSAAHGFNQGGLVTIAGVTPSGYNGTWVIATVPTTTTFTCTMWVYASAPTTESGTTATYTLIGATHNIANTNTVVVEGITPSGYNGTLTASNVTAHTFDATLGTSGLAAATLFGRVAVSGLAAGSAFGTATQANALGFNVPGSGSGSDKHIRVIGVKIDGGIGVNMTGGASEFDACHFEDCNPAIQVTKDYGQSALSANANTFNGGVVTGTGTETGIILGLNSENTTLFAMTYINLATNLTDNGSINTTYIPNTNPEIAKLPRALDLPQLTAPGNPGANTHRFYVDSADTIFKSKNSAGVVSVYGARTRSLFIDGSVLRVDAATGVKLGTPPNAVDGVSLANAITSGAYCNFIMPVDVITGTLTIRPIWVPSATDGTAHTVQWQMNIKIISAADVTATGTSVAWTGVSAARTVNVEVLETGQVSTGVSPAASDRVRLEIQRIGGSGSDTYVGDVYLVGLRIDYSANN
jgi:hypothetical protein